MNGRILLDFLIQSIARSEIIATARLLGYGLEVVIAEAGAMDGDERAERETRDGFSEPPRRTPPYISYSTLKTVLGNFQKDGIPPQIDRSVFPKFSGGVQNQVILALRSLDLIDERNEPTHQLNDIVRAHETDAYAGVLRKIIQNTYPYVFSIDLMNATPAMFADTFKNNISAKEDVLRKCRTFFLNAARDAQISIGTRIETASFPRASRSTGQRKTKTARSKVEAAPTDNQTTSSPNSIENRDVVEKLLGKFPEFDPSWPDEIKRQWFEGFERFMTGAGIRKKGDTQ